MTRTPIDEARVWMGKLPREDFDKLLLLTNEAHRRGGREGLMKACLVVTETLDRTPLPGLTAELKRLAKKEYPR